MSINIKKLFLIQIGIGIISLIYFSIELPMAHPIILLFIMNGMISIFEWLYFTYLVFQRPRNIFFYIGYLICASLIWGLLLFTTPFLIIAEAVLLLQGNRYYRNGHWYKY